MSKNYRSIFLLLTLTFSNPVSASFFQEFPDDLYIQIFSYLYPSEIERSEIVNKSFRRILKGQILRSQSPLGFKVNDKWSFWHETNLPIEEFQNLWNLETFSSAQDNNEPEYMRELSRINEYNIDCFIKEHEFNLIRFNASLSDWQEHARKILVTMCVYNICLNSTVEQAFNKTLELPNSNAYISTANEHSVFTLSSHLEKIVKKINQSISSAKLASSFAVNESIESASNLTLQNLDDENTDQSENVLIRNRYVYRLCEKIVALNFLNLCSCDEEYGSLFEIIYNNIKSRDHSKSERNIFKPIGKSVEIFESKTSWEYYKVKYFSPLDEKSKYFIEPWLKQLDRIADHIENVSVEEDQ